MFNMFLTRGLCITFLLIAFLSISVGADVVKTTHGPVSGKVLKTLIKNLEYIGYMGIPFAAPPVKELRFLPPQDIEPWEDVLGATEEKPPCIQFNTNIKKGQSIANYGTEDCLYLDIFTPAPDENKRATVVFLHNEYFKNSYNKSLDYAPDFFIEEDIIVVTMSHRLTVFGFLSLEEDLLPGNAGLKDIVAGLTWIKNNIAQFGGDPKRITLMGSRGGAAAVDLLIHSKANVLFNSAILQSGTSLLSIYLQEKVKERAFLLGKLLDIDSPSSSSLLQDLREISGEDLLAKELRAITDYFNKENQIPILNFGPVVETDSDGLITEYPENSSQKISMPVMIGFNSREGLESSLQYLSEPRFLGAITKDFPFIIPVRTNFKFDYLDASYYDAVDEIKKYYFRTKNIKMNNVADFITFIGDVLISYPMDQTARMYANLSDSPVYYYHFNYYSDFNENKNGIMRHSKVEEGTWGAASGDELCYLFRCPSLNQKYKKHHATESDEIKMQRKLIKMWGNFIKYGNPTPSEDSPLNIQWTPYSADTKEYLHIDRQIEIKRDLYKERSRFWTRFINKWELLAKDGVVSYNKKEEL